MFNCPKSSTAGKTSGIPQAMHPTGISGFFPQQVLFLSLLNNVLSKVQKKECKKKRVPVKVPSSD